MHRRLHRCCDSVVTLVVMALLPSQMRRRLAIADNDGGGMMGDNFQQRDGLRRCCDGVVAVADAQASCRCRR